MESRAFIKLAANLIEKVGNKPAHAKETTQEEAQAMQKELNQAFVGLQNPTLPSAYKLRDAALAAGYNVSHQVQQRLAQFEHLS
jgi:hypothetical protein